MIEKRPFNQLGRFENDWLNAHYHFSFSRYFDPQRMGWGKLRVWNDDTIRAGTGFPPHPHDNMEIITYVRTGAISHKDSLGNSGRTGAGDVQVMSAGSGIRHAEFNQEDEDTTLFQIWIETDQTGGEPYWETAEFPKDSGKFVTLASGRKGDEALPIRQDARILGATLKAGESETYELGEGRYAYLVVARGSADVNGVPLGPRDGAAIREEDVIRIKAGEEAELVLVDTV
ncbi:MAG: pirin family protein [Euryhalocaulis sp.]|uniref:pirin family protein n=1 Tax=Euryhalocaulis sp. TaxID=2744307 RepID=UPI00185D9D27|nr:pirin family protein [Euryhalocaulis sp.]MBA4802517.1 pirin family protein [Euryhalocaulis sp.]